MGEVLQKLWFATLKTALSLYTNGYTLKKYPWEKSVSRRLFKAVGGHS